MEPVSPTLQNSTSFTPEDFQPGGRCWPPHPQEEETGSFLVLDLGAEEDITWEAVLPALEDVFAALQVLAGKKTVAQLSQEWGLPEPGEREIETKVVRKRGKRAHPAGVAQG